MVMFLVSFMSLLRFIFSDKFLRSTLLAGVVRLALDMFKWLVVLTFVTASLSPKTTPKQIISKSKISIPNFAYVFISTPIISNRKLYEFSLFPQE